MVEVVFQNESVPVNVVYCENLSALFTKLALMWTEGRSTYQRFPEASITTPKQRDE